MCQALHRLSLNVQHALRKAKAAWCASKGALLLQKASTEAADYFPQQMLFRFPALFSWEGERNQRKPPTKTPTKRNMQHRKRHWNQRNKNNHYILISSFFSTEKPPGYRPPRHHHAAEDSGVSAAVLGLAGASVALHGERLCGGRRGCRGFFLKGGVCEGEFLVLLRKKEEHNKQFFFGFDYVWWCFEMVFKGVSSAVIGGFVVVLLLFCGILLFYGLLVLALRVACLLKWCLIQIGIGLTLLQEIQERAYSWWQPKESLE